MRVTKLIREYVEKKVKEVYPKSEAELAWEAKSKKVNEALTKANELINKASREIAEKINAEFGLAVGGYRLEGRDDTYRSIIYTTYYADCEEYQACRKAEDERRKKIKETIEEILINLELGGTKADLDEMLAKVGKGE